MATLMEVYQLYYESNLKNRVEVAIAKAAVDIYKEDPTTANHAERLAWAKIAIQNTKVETERFIWGILADSTIQTVGNSATDAQIISAVNAIVTVLAQ